MASKTKTPSVAKYDENRFINYSATTFQGDAQRGCDRAIAYLASRGFISTTFPDNTTLREGIVLDVLNDDGDILQDFHLTREGLRFLRREWNIGPMREPQYVPASEAQS